MYDHIHRQIAAGRIADQSRARPHAAHRRNVPAQPPPRFRRHAAAATAKVAMRIERESARRAMAS